MSTLQLIDDEPDRRRIRIGLAFLVAVVAISFVTGFLVDAPAGKLLMFGIGLFTVARTFSLVRALKRQR